MLGRTIKAKTGPISESGRAVLAARHYNRPVQGVGPVPIQILTLVHRAMRQSNMK